MRRRFYALVGVIALLVVSVGVAATYHQASLGSVGGLGGPGGTDSVTTQTSSSASATCTQSEGLANASSTKSDTVLASPNPQERGLFGLPVAISGDLTAVGAQGESADGWCNGGHAFVFNFTDGALVYSLTSPSPQNDAQFGSSVALNRNILLVGAEGESAGGVYAFNASTGGFLYKLTNPAPQSQEFFGGEISVSGDIGAVSTLGVNFTGLGSEGNVYLYNVTDGALMRTLTSPNAQAGGDFGISIGISGGEVIVGAPNENSGIPVNGGNSSQGFTTEGYVYIFNASAGALISTFAGPNGPALGDSDIGFGNSVAVSGNLTLIGTGNGGRAYVYDSTTGQLLQTLREPNPTENGLNGGVAVAGDVLVVGASGETAAGESGAGNVYLFNATTGTVIQTLSSQNPQPLGNFGYSLATNGEYLVVGAQGESVDGYAHAGHAYLFNLSQLASTATG